ncbi:Trehalase [Orchesella cincta]|uniref:Trehalase n=1 Tax=Orchesella cincta TaxID=48709 RepID=A0A1D2NNW1_ORCCI|nr:Trehalase [Orchesella cincta]
MTSQKIVSVACVLLASLFLCCKGQIEFGKPCSDDIYPQSQIYCHGDFLLTIQKAKLYPDQKTFVDRPLKANATEVLEKFDELGIVGDNLNDTARQTIAEFVDEYFDRNGTEFEAWEPTDWVENPSFLEGINSTDLRQWASDLHKFWKELGRKIRDDVKTNQHRQSMYYVSHPVIVPGGRFKEFYYWDSYWIQRGLLVSNMTQTVKGMIENFFEMVEQLGFIPNGGRIYYQRSQPPLLLPMVDAYFEATKDEEFIKANIGTMIKEFKFFLDNRTVDVYSNATGATHKMARYNVELTDPRPESFSEDYELVHSLDPDNQTAKDLLYANLKSGAESGWDFSSRWFVLPDGESPMQGNLTHTKTRDIIPVDLNSFIYWNAMLLTKFCGLINDNNVCNPSEYLQHANNWKDAIDDVLWDEEDGIWYDYDFVRHQKRKFFFPTNVAPLWVNATNGLTKDVAKQVVHYLHTSGATNFPGGIPTSMLQTGQQWDFPNGWAPLNHLVVEALEYTGEPTAQDLAFNLAQKWIQSNHLAYVQTEAMFEKYDVSIVGSAGSGGEYEVVVGFGWSNGVVLDFLKKYGLRLVPVDNLPSTTPADSFAVRVNAMNTVVIISSIVLVLKQLV